MYSNKIIKCMVIIHHKIKTKHFLSCDLLTQIYKYLIIVTYYVDKIKRSPHIIRNISNLLIFNYDYAFNIDLCHLSRNFTCDFILN